MLELEALQYKGFHNLYDENGEAVGFQVCCRCVSYRAPWLSQIRFDNITVDDERFGADKCTFTIGGIEYTYEEMLKEGRIKWPLNEVATIRVKKPGGLAQGNHVVSVCYKEIASYMPPMFDTLDPTRPQAGGHGNGFVREMIIV